MEEWRELVWEVCLGVLVTGALLAVLHSLVTGSRR